MQSLTDQRNRTTFLQQGCTVEGFITYRASCETPLGLTCEFDVEGFMIYGAGFEILLKHQATAEHLITYKSSQVSPSGVFTFYYLNRKSADRETPLSKRACTFILPRNMQSLIAQRNRTTFLQQGCTVEGFITYRASCETPLGRICEFDVGGFMIYGAGF
ncbi:MAG: hypothetical protein ABIQ31_15660, partial [Ferruginibacter sp.]